MRTVFIFLCCCLSFEGFSQIHSEEDKDIFNRYVESMRNKRNLPTAELVIETTRFFLGTPYVAATLEQEPEQLVINLRELDCTTFVESCLALVRTLREKGAPSFESFRRNLQQIRYRNGKITDYTSRLHYMSDWITENERHGIVTDITRMIGGIPLPLQLSFISTHPAAYKQLQADTALIRVIRETEQKINARTHYYIPKEKIDSVKEKIQNGDIIFFTTSIQGLDVSHMAYAYWEKGKLSFIHASLSEHKVIVNPTFLTEYIRRIKHNTGILVVRIN